MIQFILIGGAFVITILIGFYVILKKTTKNQDSDRSGLLFIQNQINEIGRLLDSKLTESTRVTQHQFSESAKIIRNVTEKLTKLDETNKQVVNFADQLKSLQDILKNPKQRGILGEYYLETVLKNVLPPGAFKMQYEFQNGEIVDAAIFIKDEIIPVDSKFSLENYNRLVEARDENERKRLEEALRQDLKNRIDETAKYVRPKENTLDFAFMFIPSEALYYDVLVNKVGSLNARDLIEYAWNKKVMIVSPTSFLAYLSTVLHGLKALHIEESAKTIRKQVEELSRHLIAYESYFRKLGQNLGTTVTTYNTSYKEFNKIDKDVTRITGESIEADPLILDKPNLNDEG